MNVARMWASANSGNPAKAGKKYSNQGAEAMEEDLFSDEEDNVVRKTMDMCVYKTVVCVTETDAKREKVK